MTEKNSISPRQTRAYQAFIAQLGEDLNRFESYLTGKASPSEGIRAELCGQLHRLKGSAGFFGCSALADFAKQAEEALRNLELSKFHTSIKALLDPLITAIRELLAEAP